MRLSSNSMPLEVRLREMRARMAEERKTRLEQIQTLDAATIGRDRLRLQALMPFGQKKELMEKIVLEEQRLDYAIMSGGDVGPLGKDAADAFLRTGRGSESGTMSEEGCSNFDQKSVTGLSAHLVQRQPQPWRLTWTIPIWILLKPFRI
eukprot:Skav200454  [mRNA]  locus=scaffold4319:4020:8365:+ [translate_table: standard]